MELENYVIERYNPWVIDMTKYFIPDEDYNSDVTPVHYEKLYETVSQDILGKISNSDYVQTYDVLPYYAVKAVFSRNLDQVNFKKYLAEIKNPFSGIGLLHSVFAGEKQDELIENRHFVARVYSFFSSYESVYETEIDLMINVLPTFSIENDETNKFHQNIIAKLDFLKEIITLDIEELKSLFDMLLGKNDLRWISCMEVLCIKYPDTEIALTYIPIVKKVLSEI